jgi:hypothetical protein
MNTTVYKDLEHYSEAISIPADKIAMGFKNGLLMIKVHYDYKLSDSKMKHFGIEYSILFGSIPVEGYILYHCKGDICFVTE